MTHPMRQDSCDNIGPTVYDVIGVVGLETDRYLWRHHVLTPLPLFIELKKNEFPFPSIANDATNDFYPVQILRKMNAYQKAGLTPFA